VLRQKWTESRLFGAYAIAQWSFLARRHAFTWRCKYQLGQLDNVLVAGQLHQGCDRAYKYCASPIG
jgi:predicted nucleic acid-binding protein